MLHAVQLTRRRMVWVVGAGDTYRLRGLPFISSYSAAL